MRVVVVLFCLIHYVHSYCMVDPVDGHVSAADLSAELGVSTVIGTASSNYNQYISSGFYKCTTLKSIVIPASVTTIENRAFYETTNLKNITFLGNIATIKGGSNYMNGAFSDSGENAAAMSITFMGNVGTIEEYAFYDSGENAATMSITFMGTVTTISKNAFKYSGYYTDTMSITFMEDVGTIAMNAFLSSGNRGKMSVEFQKDVTTISENAFKYSGMASTTYGGSKGFIHPSAFSNSAYEKCRLDETPPGMNLDTGHGTYNGTSSDTFEFCRLLTSVTILSSVKSIGENAFKGTTALTSVTLPDGLEEIGVEAFRDTGLTSVTIPSSVTTIPASAFRGAALASVTLPDGLISIGNYAFYNTALTSVTLPSSVITIGNYAFEDTRLNSVIIPGSVTSIGNYAFYMNTYSGYTAMTSATVPVCTNLGTDAFNSATNVVKSFSRGCLDSYVAEGITYAQVASALTPEELKAAYRAKGSCPN